MSEKISDERLAGLIEFTSGHSVEANAILVELQSLRSRISTLEEALREIDSKLDSPYATFSIVMGDIRDIARRALEQK